MILLGVGGQRGRDPTLEMARHAERRYRDALPAKTV